MGNYGRGSVLINSEWWFIMIKPHINDTELFKSVANELGAYKALSYLLVALKAYNIPNKANIYSNIDWLLDFTETGIDFYYKGDK